jgi:hypothetical protein
MNRYVIALSVVVEGDGDGEAAMDAVGKASGALDGPLMVEGWSVVQLQGSGPYVAPDEDDVENVGPVPFVYGGTFGERRTELPRADDDGMVG